MQMIPVLLKLDFLAGFLSLFWCDKFIKRRKEQMLHIENISHQIFPEHSVCNIFWVTLYNLWVCVWKLISMSKKEPNMSSPADGEEARPCSSLPASRHIVALTCRQEERQVSDRKMKDERWKAKKCFVKLILMWGTSLGCLTSSPGAEIY